MDVILKARVLKIVKDVENNAWELETDLEDLEHKIAAFGYKLQSIERLQTEIASDIISLRRLLEGRDECWDGRGTDGERGSHMQPIPVRER